MSKIDQLISMSEKRTELLREYKQSRIYEQCLYEVVATPGRTGNFMLFDIATKTCVRDGNASYVCSWLSRRKIPAVQVYNSSLIQYEHE